MDRISRFIRRFIFNYKNAFGALSFSGYLIFRVINPFFQLVFFCTVAKYVYNTTDVTPWVIGNALTLCYFSAFYGVGQTFVSERSQGTLKAIISAPTSTIHIVLPRVLSQSVDAFVSVFVGFLAGAALFNFTMPLNTLLPSLLVITVAIFSAMGIGLLIGAFALLTRDINMLLNVASMVLIALTGSNFDVKLLPVVLQWVSYALPLTRSIQLMRLIAKGNPLSNHLNLLYGEFFLGLIFFVIGMATFHIIERLSLKHATLDLY